MDEAGIKNFEELTRTENSLRSIEFMERVVAAGLTFQGSSLTWTVEKLQTMFADLDEITKVFRVVIELTVPQAKQPSKLKVNRSKGQGPYT